MKREHPDLLPRSQVEMNDFLLLGSRLRVTSGSARVVGEISEFLTYYAAPGREGAEIDNGVDLEFHIDVGRPTALPVPRAGVERVHRFEMYPGMFFDLYEGDGQLWTVVDGCDWTHTDIARGRTEVRADSARLDIRPRYVTMALVFPILVDYLQCRSHFVFHCAGTVRKGRAVLLAGPSGGGKSTLTLSLLRAGHQLLADDMCILTVGPTGSPVLRGFREDLAVCPDVVSLLPSLGSLPPPLPDEKKIRIPRDRFFPDHNDLSARPGLILVPRIDPRGHRLIPLPKDEAFRRFARSALFVTGKRGLQERTFAVIDLLEQSETYELLLGPDMESAPGIIDSAMEALAP